ncbi:cyclin-dependent kinase 4 inhibitor C [Latimeria chalumnae]|uniref:Cyclin dependent kinase inhibitor 2C n=1 Tax=Latimeria chalumnae TaxID=7897 RepID=H3A9X3_LATCH|nr:PREDICTED: cyclin-dependent kinase 4 inhibitor C [Latimeria chalumnae]|eukprot:XP_006012072.1 PREDICTED: cyclin-dependent kinase 4 inhibitor C [Latimeria chalumnae]
MADVSEANSLSTAAVKGNQREVEFLLEVGANVNAKNEFGRTALQVMQLGHVGIAKVLLHAGADPNLKDRTGYTVVHDTARAGFCDTLQILLQYKADVNIEDDGGNLPLHLAAQEGHLDIVKILIQKANCDPNHRNKEGRTVYQVAKMYERETVVKWMEENLDM